MYNVNFTQKMFALTNFLKKANVKLNENVGYIDACDYLCILIFRGLKQFILVTLAMSKK